MALSNLSKNLSFPDTDVAFTGNSPLPRYNCRHFLLQTRLTKVHFLLNVWLGQGFGVPDVMKLLHGLWNDDFRFVLPVHPICPRDLFVRIGIPLLDLAERLVDGVE